MEGLLSPGDEGVAGLGKLSDGYPAPLSDEVGHSSQFLWGYVDELAPVVNHTCGDMQVVGLSPPGTSQSDLIPTHSFTTSSEPSTSPVCLTFPDYIQSWLGESNQALLPVLKTPQPAPSLSMFL